MGHHRGVVGIEGPVGEWDSLDMDALWMALQPIVDLRDGRLFGHEALVQDGAIA